MTWLTVLEYLCDKSGLLQIVVTCCLFYVFGDMILLLFYIMIQINNRQ